MPATPGRRVHRATRFALAMTLVVAAASAAHAQDPRDSPRGYSGLFEPGDALPRDAARPIRLPGVTLSAGVFGMVDRAVAAGAAPGAAPPRPDNSSTALDLQGTWRGAGRRLSWEARAGSQLRRYADLRALELDQQFAGLTLRFRRDRKTTIAAATRMAYLPQYMFGLPMPGNPSAEIGAATPAEPGLEFSSLRSLNLGTVVGITRRLDPRTTAEARYSGTRTVFVDQERSVINQRVFTRMERRMGARLALRGRYELGQVRTRSGLATDTRVSTHQVDLGVRYTLRSFTETTVEASLTPSFSRRSAAALPGIGDAAPAQFTTGGPHLGGTASVEHRLAGGVRLGIGYQRAFYTDAAYVVPVFLQATSARVQGDVGSRAMWSATISHSTGGSAGVSSIPGTYGAAASVQFRLSREVVLTGDYQLAVLQRVASSANAWRRLDGHRLRVGLTVTSEAARTVRR